MRLIPLIILVLSPFLLSAALPRVVIALYDSVTDPDISSTQLHQMAEMPLNHLGVVLEYTDIRSPLPDLQARRDVLGVISWFREEMVLSRGLVEEYLKWAIHTVQVGKKYVVLGNPGFSAEGVELPPGETNRFWNLLGLRDTGEWLEDTYQIKLERYFPRMTQFERPYTAPYPTFRRFVTLGKGTTCYLAAKREGEFTSDGCLVAISKAGGYVASDYESYYKYELGRTSRDWFINPFLFFRTVFQTDTFPKPDMTTLAGRRIYYSQIDGDGWNNITEVWGYLWNTLAVEVIYDKILKVYEDLPVTVAPIAADIDLEWVGSKASQNFAKQIFLLPHVEVGCHTFTHPFDWGFFENYEARDEIPFLSLYPNGSWLGRGLMAKLRTYFHANYLEEERDLQPRPEKTFESSYVVPRAFALQPFSLSLEVKGAIQEISQLTPPKKEIKLYQWSGNCLPFYEAISQVIQSGLADINGGNSRFDRFYPSYGWVAPIGRQVKDLHQIYASAANENVYTNLWSSDFFGFYLLPETWRNTETPLRVKPMNLYYHIYSAQKVPALKAVIENLEYVRTQEICPIAASDFAKMARGFYSTQFEQVGKESWKVKTRGTLQTIRFDEASDLAVDFQASRGVVGERHSQGALYVYLDQLVEEPLIQLKSYSSFHEEPKESIYYLIHSRWPVWQMERRESGVEFLADGFGEGEMVWNVPSPGVYEVVASDEKKVITAVGQELKFSVKQNGTLPHKITIQRKKDL